MAGAIYNREFDVVICGGGVSGCTAAIAAARSGASVLVIAQNGYLGGSLTACGVGPMMTFHAGEKQVIRGIMQELVDALKARGWSSGHVADTKQYTSTITPFSAEGLKLILDEKLRQAGCEVLFHTFLGHVNVEDGAICSITVCNKDGLHELSGRVFVDATGDGDLAAWSGETMTKGTPGGRSCPADDHERQILRRRHGAAQKLRSGAPRALFPAGAAHGAVPGHGTGRSGGL